MSVTLTQIREGIAANLKASLTGCQVSAYVLANPTPPCLWVRLNPEEGVLYSQAMQEGSQTWHMLIEGWVGAVADIGAQKKLDAWIAPFGDQSVRAAIESDLTLGGVLGPSQMTVQECNAYEKYVLPDGSEVLGAKWSVMVIT